MALEVPLGGRIAAGRVALVDEADAWVLECSWSVNGRGYVQRAGVSKVPVLLHRELLDFPAGLVDHKNRDRLDNRRSNLRAVTALENGQNHPPRRGTSTHRGVYRNRWGRWVATASRDGRSLYLGTHLTEEDAAEASHSWRRLHMAGATD